MAQAPEKASVTAPEKKRIKPRLRGVSHEIAAYLSAIAGAALVWRAWDRPEARLGAAVYSFCLFFLFAASAVYHRPTWTPEARAWMRRLDHSAIYLLIAGTSTPIALVALSDRSRSVFLGTLWVGALLGMLKSLLWVKAPKALSALVYVLLSLAAVPYFPEMRDALGAGPAALILAGGLVYIAGAAVYALRRPDPWPETFGYHEIFHALVILAAAMHYGAVWQTVSAS